MLSIFSIIELLLHYKLIFNNHPMNKKIVQYINAALVLNKLEIPVK